MEKGNYTAEDKEFMCITNKACNKSRLAELISFIKLNGYRKIGVAYCFSVKAVAEKAERVFCRGRDRCSFCKLQRVGADGV